MTTGQTTTTVNLIASQILKWYSDARQCTSAKPLVVGISGPQGCGKTTLVKMLLSTLASPTHGLNVVAFSMDDLYLTYDEQTNVAKRYPGNKLVEFRGNPGTHDVELGRNTLKSLIKRHKEYVKCGVEVPTLIPSYNKASHAGLGDQNPMSEWRKASPPHHIILFEGWALGFKRLPLPDLMRMYHEVDSEMRKHPFEHVRLINESAEVWEKEWYGFIDAFVHLWCRDVKVVYEWRSEAEHTLRRELNNPNAGMSDAQVREFVSRFMPFYEIGLPRLTKYGFFGDQDGEMPEENRGKYLKIEIDEKRDPVSFEIM
ncbi:hypothetical protein SeMB42_g06064 [Synchytrium endobioticum]|uniref:Phosphoribulokinase/uridine kinase domain-containing protein n=1 Tax=Synchytrium endobioticum TaxID=286115 RepID=A0A507CKE2_9FUNG|nr:hypothetical protein SeMB42_g06064 [Synchytrium endobioticum]TPX42000.1 hypothetical protein SeLEV6574_g05814 [Synchytrium endobioticum]